MRRRRRTPLFPLLAASAVALAVPSCGPRGPSPVPRPAPAPAANGPAPTASAFVGPPAPEGERGPPADVLGEFERLVAAGIARAVRSAVALEYTSPEGPAAVRRVASGVVVSDDGDLLSVRVDADAPSAASLIVAKVASGRRLPARWVAADPETGLTLLKIAPGFAIRAVTPASPAGPLRGTPVLVIGNPFGLAHSVNRGFVAGLNRRAELGPRKLGGLIQVDAAIHPGDSGALLADLRGNWLGVVRGSLGAPAEKGKEKDKETRAREYDYDLGLAIPAADALWVAAQLRSSGRVERAYLGVTMDLKTPVAAEGAVLSGVLADTPAGRAGLQAGDRVVALDGVPVRSSYELTDRLDRTPADADVTLVLLRDPVAKGNPAEPGSAPPPPERLSLTIRTAHRPPPEASPAAATRPPAAAPPPSSTSTSTELAKGTEPRPGTPPAPESRPPLSPDVAATIERLEHRIRELEKRDAGASQSQHP